MFEQILKEISKNNVYFLRPMKKGNILLNPAIFGYSEPKDLYEYKNIFIARLYNKKQKLENLHQKIQKSTSLEITPYKTILDGEIQHIYKKIDFLKNVYDFEANKIDGSYNIGYPELDYDYYNKEFFGVTKQDISEDNRIIRLRAFDIFLTRQEVINLLEKSKELIVGMNYKIGNYAFMSHSDGTLMIPKKENYTLREIVTLFFHEMTHFFRRYNGLRNLGFSYNFSDYMKIEEGFALYNEYFYGRQLFGKLRYNPYYDVCYGIILSDISEEEKKRRIIAVLTVKGYSKQKALFYYYRFYRYTKIGNKDLFLKDLIYTKGYQRVKRLLKKDPNNYDKIFSGQIGPKGLKHEVISIKNNFDARGYFEYIIKALQKYV